MAKKGRRKIDLRALHTDADNILQNAAFTAANEILSMFTFGVESMPKTQLERNKKQGWTVIKQRPDKKKDEYIDFEEL